MVDLIPVEHDPFAGDPGNAPPPSEWGRLPEWLGRAGGVVRGAGSAPGEDIGNLAEAMTPQGYLENYRRLIGDQPNAPPAFRNPSDQPMAAPSPADIAGFLTMHLAGGAPADTLSAGIRAYHGSPHDFPAFDIDKIGTGEGAQAYGHGLYFAEHEPVAQSYRDALSAPVTNDYVLSDNSGKIPDWAGKQIAQYPPGHEYRNGVIDRLTDLFRQRIAEQDAQWSNQPWMADANKQGLQELIDNLGRIKSGEVDLAKPQPTGKMYEVNLDVDPEHLLDWDKPLSQQPEVARRLSKGGLFEGDLESEMRKELHARVNDQQLDEGPALQRWYEELQNALKTAKDDEIDKLWDKQRVIENWWDEGIPEGDGAGLDPTGASLHRMLSERFTKLPNIVGSKSQPTAAEALREAGIPGIRYLDQGSRGAGEGSHNYVIFDDKLIDILKKYGLGGLVAGGALAIGGNAEAATHAVPVDHQPDFGPVAGGS
jgi:hypothetical protein